jgi:hypothetical protein
MVSPPAGKRQDDKQLRRDRWTAIIVVAVMAALMALVIWLASLGGGVEYEGMDYWHMMP